MDAQAAETPAGNPVAVPIPVAPVVECVISVKTELAHNVGVEEAVPAVFNELTMIVPVAFTDPHPPVNGME